MNVPVTLLNRTDVIWFLEDEMFDGSATDYPREMQMAKLAQDPSIRSKVQFAVERAEAQLKDAKRMQELLDKNPELEELVNIMQRQRYL
jgi:hypothetical protein